MTVERMVSRILFWGGVVGTALMLAGLVGFGVRAGVHGEALNVPRVMENRAAGHAADVFASVPQVFRGLRHRPLDPLALAALGILTLLATPVTAVVAAIPAFVVAGDGRYATIAGVLAAVLIVSLLAGGG
jgi:uncharacterized membrane protein